MDPATLAAVASVAGKPAPGLNLIGAGLQYIPSKAEKEYARAVRGDMRRTAGGAGYSSAGVRQQVMGDIAGQTEAQKQSQLADISRGAGTSQGGQALKARGDIYRTAQQAGMAGMGTFRGQDLQAAMAARQAAMQGLQQVAQNEMTRRTAALDRLGSMSPEARQRGLERGKQIGQRSLEGLSQVSAGGAPA